MELSGDFLETIALPVWLLDILFKAHFKLSLIEQLCPFVHPERFNLQVIFVSDKRPMHILSGL